jgi:UDP-2,3-diacylglucosamine pyrophosphatase LpxH
MGGRIKIIVSDLHLGAGFVPENPLEDFGSDDEFAEFLDGIMAESDEKALNVELIINGDMVEFLQVPAAEAFDPTVLYPAASYKTSSEVASTEKMLLVIQGHLTFFAALRNFVHPGEPRRSITIIKGNHDVNLYWPAVQDAIRVAVGATGERLGLLTFEERCVSREGIYVEHGNQYVEKVNRFDNFEEPQDPENPGELEMVPGSEFVIDFFNGVEREKWWVDAIKPITALIWYGFALDFAFAASVLVSFLRVAPKLFVGSFAVESDGGVGDGTGVQMDELRLRLEDEAEVATMGDRYARDVSFRREFDAQLSQILHAADAPPEVQVPDAAVGAEALEKAQDITELSDVALRKVAQAKIVTEGAQVVVFGHTHRPLCEQLDGGVHVNCGTWVWWRDFAGMDLETWQRLYAHPEDFVQPHYLTYVRVDYDSANRPRARVLDFTGQLVVECARSDKIEGFWEQLLAWLKRLWLTIKGRFNADSD